MIRPPDFSQPILMAHMRPFQLGGAHRSLGFGFSSIDADIPKAGLIIIGTIAVGSSRVRAISHATR